MALGCVFGCEIESEIGSEIGRDVVVLVRAAIPEVQIKDLPKIPCRIRLVCRHDQERRRDFHKVPSPWALKVSAPLENVLRSLLLLPTT
jgi:hypothetical protein